MNAKSKKRQGASGLIFTLRLCPECGRQVTRADERAGKCPSCGALLAGGEERHGLGLPDLHKNGGNK